MGIKVTVKPARVSASLGTPVIQEFIDIPEYSGSYEITPTEETQTLETEEKKLTHDLIVGAIPSDYVGSGIQRRGEKDLSASGDTVTVPAGYYSESESKAIQAGSAATPATTIHADPSISLDPSTGEITATVAGSEDITPVVSPGYVAAGVAGTVGVSGSDSLKLETVAGSTIRPTEKRQTAVPARKWTTGAVDVGAIPSDYVGSEIQRRDEKDLSASGDTVTVPAGYYSESESKAIQAGSAATPATTIHADPSISLDPSTGEITATVAGSEDITPVVSPGYVAAGVAGAVGVSGSNSYSLPTKAGETITPTTQEQTAVPGGKFTLGDVKIGPIPSQYHDMSGPLAWLGVDAELVKEITLADVKLKDTAFASWTPSTTAADILATRTAGTFVAADVENYNYFIVWETKIPIVTDASAVQKALPLFLAAYQVQNIMRRPSSYTNIQAQSDNNTVNVSAYVATNFFRYYGSTQGSITYTWNTSYGIYATVTANTISSTTAANPTITLKSPKVSARCSTTYMSTANAALIDQDKTVISQKCKVYKVKRPALMQGIYDELIRLVNEVDS